MNSGEFSAFVGENCREIRSSGVYPPELDDLYFLYCFVRDTSAVSVLELGGGFSTLAMAKALRENELSFGTSHRSCVRHPNPFKLLSVDASKKFSELARARLPPDLLRIVNFHVSGVSAAQWGGDPGQMCFLYDDLPNFCPDIVYLDGPDSDQIDGLIRGYEFEQPHSLPMGADLLTIEPHLWPGTFIVTDGRLANAHFLRNNFRRAWEFFTDVFGDRVLMRLSSESLGEVNSTHLKIRFESSRDLRGKESPLRGR